MTDWPLTLAFAGLLLVVGLAVVVPPVNIVVLGVRRGLRRGRSPFAYREARIEAERVRLLLTERNGW